MLASLSFRSCGMSLSAGLPIYYKSGGESGATLKSIVLGCDVYLQLIYRTPRLLAPSLA